MEACLESGGAIDSMTIVFAEVPGCNETLQTRLIAYEPLRKGFRGLRSPGLQPINMRAMRGASMGEMVFVPAGQHDSTQARSASNRGENSRVPAGRLNRSQLR